MLNEPHELLTRAKAVDAKLAKWIETIPVHWIPYSVSADDVPKASLMQEYMGISATFIQTS